MSPRIMRRTNRGKSRRKRPAKKPLENFLDGLAGMLEDLAGTAIFGAGEVLLGRALGTPAPPRMELPPGLPPEVAAEWERLMGIPPKPARGSRRKVETAETVVGEPAPRPEPVKLLKGADGVYRPEPGSSGS